MDNKLQILEKYNLWGGNTFKTGFLRKEYTDKISRYLGNNLIKVLTGQRRVGKSYVLRQIAMQLVNSGVSRENILFLNFELADFDDIKTHKDLDEIIKKYVNGLKPKGKVYLFFDEIQNIQDWEIVINSYSQDYIDDYEIFISGSNSKMLSGELAGLLSGRYVSFNIFPFSFKEFCGINGYETNKQSYLEYMETGGMPELFHLNEEEVKRNYILSLKDTVMLRDIIQRYRVKEPVLLEDVFVFLVNNASNLISVKNIANYFKSNSRKTSYDTIAAYIGYFEDAFLVHRAERYNIKGKELLTGNRKYYINDLSFGNYLYKGFGYGVGYKLENLVYLDLLRAGYAVYTGQINKKEVDFVALKSDQKVYVQSAYLLFDNDTIEREYASLESIADNYPKYVVSLDDVKLSSKQGIEHIRAWEFSNLVSEF